MKIVVGLGNPGTEYENTRHNLGFMAIDKVSELLKIKINKDKMLAKIGSGTVDGEKVLLVKPQTYMNLSGDSVSKIMHFYKAEPKDLIVIYDDIDIEVGKIRVKSKGSAGTHNGMRDIIAKIDSENFARVRVGSGKPIYDEDLANYVLSNIKKEEQDSINKATDDAAKATIEIIKNGIQSAMNNYN